MARLRIQLLSFGVIRRGRLLRVIDEMQSKFDRGLTRQDIVDCHEIKLALIRGDAERRLRSIQTLARLGEASALGPAILDLRSSAKKWPDRRSIKISAQLFRVLRTLESSLP